METFSRQTLSSLVLYAPACEMQCFIRLHQPAGDHAKLTPVSAGGQGPGHLCQVELTPAFKSVRDGTGSSFYCRKQQVFLQRGEKCSSPAQPAGLVLLQNNRSTGHAEAAETFKSAWVTRS